MFRFITGSRVIRTFYLEGNRLSSNSATIPNRLKDKVAIVTASTDGIGLAIAKRLATDGAKVVVSSRKQSNVEKAIGQLTDLGLNVHGVKCHVGLPEDRSNLLRETINKYGGLDILVSNAATNPFLGRAIDCTEEAWDKIFDVNIKASFLLARDAVPLMKKRDGGNIVFISSLAGFRPFEYLGPYSVSKTALFGLTKVLAIELASDNIRVNCVAPGIIQTRFSNALHESEEIRNKLLEEIPLKRIGQPNEIGGVISFLVSDDASYITGEIVMATGGMTSRL